MAYSEIFKEKLKRYEITNDRKLLFELQDGEKVELACDECGNTIWDIGVLKEEELTFRLTCLNCFKGLYYLWFEPGKPKKS